MGFQEGGQRQALSQVLFVFVGGEAGAIGCDFEQHAAWLPDHHATEGLEAIARRLNEFCESRYAFDGRAVQPGPQ